ncbi:MAG: hypothetical protein Q8P81_00360 [Nanoarchaeota archaeon]|nr:hypothetical protein [Nanoarchaeota archaeon]
MNRGLIGGVFVLALIVLGAFILFKGGVNQTGSVVDTSLENEGISVSPLEPKYHVVEITSSGFSPRVVEIDQGDIVTWVNRDSKRHWPASDDHPIHDAYPEFDSKRPLKADEDWDFQFDKRGEWEYHDHLNPSFTGTIFVR